MPKVPSMLYIRPYLYAITDGGIATCMRAESGEIVWQERVGGNYSASPVEPMDTSTFFQTKAKLPLLMQDPNSK
jgi:outer membrane protein assembly factor BamB